MLDNLTEPKEKLIYAYALLRGYYENININDAGMIKAIDDVMSVFSDVINNTEIYKKH